MSKFRLRITGDLGFEFWMDIPKYEGLYQVSTYGRVKSVERKCFSIKGERTVPEKILSCKGLRNGYPSVSLSKYGKPVNLAVHRAVYETFIGNIPEGMEVNHIDEEKTNAMVFNLNLMTRKENANWGTAIERTRKKNINGKKSKPVLQYDLEGNFIKEYPSTMEVERQTGINNTNVSQVCLGKYKQVNGFVFKYKKDGQ